MNTTGWPADSADTYATLSPAATIGPRPEAVVPGRAACVGAGCGDAGCAVVGAGAGPATDVPRTNRPASTPPQRFMPRLLPQSQSSVEHRSPALSVLARPTAPRAPASRTFARRTARARAESA